MTEKKAKIFHVHSLLIEACKKNDRRAQNEIYRLYFKSMYNISLRMVRNEQIAEDLMQESFLSAFSNISSFRLEVSFGVWLKRIVINKSIDYLKKKKLVFNELNENINPNREEPADDDYIKYKAKQIVDGINQLPDGYRIIMNLYLIEGYDHEEIADILNISASTSRSQYTRAKRKLLKDLNRE